MQITSYRGEILVPTWPNQMNNIINFLETSHKPADMTSSSILQNSHLSQILKKQFGFHRQGKLLLTTFSINNLIESTTIYRFNARKV